MSPDSGKTLNGFSCGDNPMIYREICWMTGTWGEQEGMCYKQAP